MKFIFSLLIMFISFRDSYSQDSDYYERIETLADIWARVFIFHPAIVNGDIRLNWSEKLIKTLSHVKNVKTDEQFVSLINDSLLCPLKDPFTFAQSNNINLSKKNNIKHDARSIKLPPSMFYLNLTDYEKLDHNIYLKYVDSLFKTRNRYDTLIVDLRYYGILKDAQYVNDRLLSIFIDSSFSNSRLNRIHHGWSEKNSSSNVYHQKIIQEKSYHINSNYTSLYQKLKNRHKIFLINNGTVLYAKDILDNLQNNKQTTVVWENAGHYNMPVNNTVQYRFCVVHYNFEMLISKSNRSNFTPHIKTHTVISSDSLLHYTRNSFGTTIPAQDTFTFQFRLPDIKTYPFYSPTVVPNLDRYQITNEEKIFGFIKLWYVVKYFYPHQNFVALHWKNDFKYWLREVEKSNSALEYYYTLLALTTFFNDSHISFFGASVTDGAYCLPIKTCKINNSVIIFDIDSVTKENHPDISRGDEIISINHKNIETIEDQWKGILSASKKDYHKTLIWGNQYYPAFPCIMNDSSDQIVLSVQRKNRFVDFELRANKKRHEFYAMPEEPYIKIIHNIGYINLWAIPNLTVFKEFISDTNRYQGILLDMRGYQRSGIHGILKHLTADTLQSGLFMTPIVSGKNYHKLEMETVQRQITAEPDLHYAGPIVVLINEMAMSAAEDFCIYLKNSKRALFVGTPTAGCNGNIAEIYLPGGVITNFTGMVVKYADGSPFQGIGIIPDIEVHPTIEGIKAGRDEILEKGIEVMKKLNEKGNSYDR